MCYLKTCMVGFGVSSYSRLMQNGSAMKNRALPSLERKKRTLSVVCFFCALRSSEVHYSSCFAGMLSSCGGTVSGTSFLSERGDDTSSDVGSWCLDTSSLVSYLHALANFRLIIIWSNFHNVEKDHFMTVARQAFAPDTGEASPSHLKNVSGNFSRVYVLRTACPRFSACAVAGHHDPTSTFPIQPGKWQFWGYFNSHNRQTRPDS